MAVPRQNASRNPRVLYWLAIGILAQLLMAPSISITKISLGSLEPTTFNLLRAIIEAAVAAPFVLWFWRRFTRRNITYALGVGVSTSVAAILTTYAVQNSQASYVIVMTLLSPIFLVVLSRYFFHEVVRLRAVAGVTLAALGALVALTLPLIIGGHTSFAVYPFATVLILIADAFLALMMVFMRKANEAGLPLISTQGVAALVVVVVSYVVGVTVNGTTTIPADIPPVVWLGLGYAAVFVLLIGRTLVVASYERVGAATTSGLSYLGLIAALIIPIVFLRETLSVGTIIGGVLILCGVYLTERHHAAVRHRWHIMWHH